mmetsp:Transcript_67321/g.161408  ORF Transcript_67321/g.161408 Transcript_67321/m.161408 type:complete len:392 (-) Transcript_67321:117-1292(-)
MVELHAQSAGPQAMTLTAIASETGGELAGADALRLKKETMRQLTRGSLKLDDVEEELKSDKHVVLAAILHDGQELKWAPETLRGDAQFILVAVRHNPAVLQWAPPSLRLDREFVLGAVKRQAAALQWAPEVMRSDKQVVLEAVQRRSEALQWASEDCRADAEIVHAAVQRHPSALQWAAEQVRSDKELVLEAVKRWPESLQWTPASLREDKEIILTVVQRSLFAARYLPAHALESDVDVLMTMTCTYGKQRLRTIPSSISLINVEPDVAFLNRVAAEHPNAFKDSYLFHIILLSGRSFCVILPRATATVSGDEQWLKQMQSSLLSRCLEELLLVAPSPAARGTTAELFHGDAPLSNDEAIHSLRCGEVHELTLVLKNCFHKKRRIREDPEE